MTSAVFIPGPWWRSSQSTIREAARTDPPTPRKRAPVFIYDAITPWQGETLLSRQLKADIEQALADADTPD
jgi:hypothetical protein